MLKWALALAAVAVVLGALMYSGFFQGPAQAPVILVVLLVLAAGLALLARRTVYKKMK